MAIGSVPISNRPVTPATPSAQDLGAGISSALGSIGESLQQRALLGESAHTTDTGLALAYKQRQDQLTNANLQVEFLQLQYGLEQHSVEAFANADNLQDFTNSVEQEATKQLGAFMQKVPANMRPDFLPKAEAFRLQLAENAFRLQTDGENAQYTSSISTLQTQMLNQILASPIKSLDDVDALGDAASARVEEMLRASPLGPTATKELRKQLDLSIREAKFRRLALEEAKGTGSLGGAVETPQGQRAAGLPAVAIGLGNAIAGVESGGDYGLMYSPDPNNKRKFTDFSKHPNDPAIINYGEHAGKKSTASGKYMFTYGTWKEISQKYGLGDFTPPNQELGMWLKARDEYANATGRNLEADLSSGSPVLIAGARKVLANTWEGLKNMSDAEFVKAVSSGQATPSSLLTDEEFSDIPYDTKVGYLLDAQSQMQKQQAAQQALQNQQRDAAFNELLLGLQTNKAGMVDIQQFESQFGADFERRKKALGVLQEANAQSFAAASFATKLSSPLFALSTEEDKQQFGAYLQTTGLTQAITDKNAAYFAEIVMPAVAKTGYAPPVLVDALTVASGSRDPQQAMFAWDTLNALRSINETQFEQNFGKDISRETTLFNAAKTILGPEELLNYMRGQNDPVTSQLYEEREKALKKVIADDPEGWSPEKVADNLGFSGQMTGPQMNALYADFMPTLTYMNSRLNNPNAAWDATIAHLKKTWGTSTIGGQAQFLKYAPELIAPEYAGSKDYVQEQFQDAFAFQPGTRVVLSSDSKTEQQFLGGQSPTYMLYKQDADGLIIGPVTYRDLRGFNPREDGALANQPIRWGPSITPQMVQSLIYQTQKQQELKNATTLFGGNQGKDYLTAQAQLATGQDDFYSTPQFYEGLDYVLSRSRSPFMQELAKPLSTYRPKTKAEALAKLNEIESNINKIKPIFPRMDVLREVTRMKRLLEE